MNEKHEREEERDDIGALVRLAGKRRPVSRERAERVRATAHAHWRGEVRRRSRRRFVWAAAATLTAAASLVAVLVLRPDAAGPSGAGARVLVEALTGGATLREPDHEASSRAVEVGATLAIGHELVTSERGRTAIRLASGHSIRLDSSTRIRLLDRGIVALDEGTIYVDSGIGPVQTAALAVQTPLGVIDEIGTQFEVRLDDESIRVRLREGAVVLRGQREVVEVVAGTELRVLSDGSRTTRAISTHGPDWDWIAGITPMLELEGRSARAFLDWVARERGWILAFDDESLAASAERIVLDGSLRRLTLDQALDAVLPTCRMRYRVKDGVLLIASDQGSRTD